MHHAGDLIALGSKSSVSKAPSRHPASDSDDSAKSSSTLAAAGNSAKKFKPAASSDNPGGLFSDPIRVSQVGQPGSSGKQVSSGKGSHGLSPQPSGGSGTQQIIEGGLVVTFLVDGLL